MFLWKPTEGRGSRPTSSLHQRLCLPPVVQLGRVVALTMDGVRPLKKFVVIERDGTEQHERTIQQRTAASSKANGGQVTHVPDTTFSTTRSPARRQNVFAQHERSHEEPRWRFVLKTPPALQVRPSVTTKKGMAGALPTTTVDVPPNQTLFCYNLNTKIPLPDLKSCLFELFSAYGKILDVVASKADPRKRGNAFVVFGDIAAATTALRGMHGREFLGRPLGLSYAKTKSDKVAMLEGTFKVRRQQRPDPRHGRPVGGGGAAVRAAAPQEEKAMEDEDGDDALRAVATLPGKASVAGATLFVENLPPIMNEGALSVLFNQYPGFQEARVVSGRGVGFVDFNNELQAELAMQGLNGFLVTPEAALKISMARK